MSQLPPHKTLARLASVLSKRLVFAKINADLTTAEISHNWAHLLPREPLDVGIPITFLTVFADAQEALQDVLAGRLAEFVLEDVNDETAEGVRYLTYSVHPFDPHEPEQGLLLMVEEVTPVSQLKQKIVQERNELRLVRIELDRSNENLRRVSELKSLFLALAAHDLRTPLTAIRGYADLVLRQQTADNRTSQYLRTIINQTDFLDKLVQDVLDLEAIRQGQLRVELSRQDLGAILHTAVTAALPVAESQQVNLYLSLPVQPIWAKVDGKRIQQIVHNLISNSVRYTDRAGEIEVALHLDTAATCLITVRDTGDGITPERLPYLFKLSYELPESEKQQRGTGIGLYLVQMLTQLHGGTVSVNSIVGEGTTFAVQLPIC
ncbi:MAG: HAMP domain-containing histidine kinase [Chloroflexi bacterium]|nr:HAMP domain-containing histidine kinase [Chloroflexota bacterium]